MQKNKDENLNVQDRVFNAADPFGLSLKTMTQSAYNQSQAEMSNGLIGSNQDSTALRVAILEDNLLECHAITNLLEENNCTVLVENSGAHFLDLLKKENFEVMVYSSDDPILCKQLEDMGAAAIMPLGSLIGSGRGIQNRFNISIIKTQSKVPVIVDAGIGCASDAAIAMELGCDGVLVNTAVAEAKNPILMAEAMKDAVIAGRKSFIAGRIKKKVSANPSSPFEGLIE